MRKEMDLTLVNLIDPESETIKQYGILNEEHGEIPHPAAYVIDQKGKIRFVQIDENYKMRPSNETLLGELRAIRDSEEG